MTTTPRISLWGIIPLVVLIGLATMLLLRIENPRDAGSVDSPLIGHKLPSLGFTVKGPVVINMFASWCVPCRAEHPFLLVAKGRGVHIIGIAYKDTQPEIDHYIHTYGQPYDAVHMDEDGKIGITLGITGVPESFLVDENGIVRKRIQGPFPSVPALLSFAGAR